VPRSQWFHIGKLFMRYISSPSECHMSLKSRIGKYHPSSSKQSQVRNLRCTIFLSIPSRYLRSVNKGHPPTLHVVPVFFTVWYQSFEKSQRPEDNKKTLGQPSFVQHGSIEYEIRPRVQWLQWLVSEQGLRVGGGSPGSGLVQPPARAASLA